LATGVRPQVPSVAAAACQPVRGAWRMRLRRKVR
jgi:hypothetical protein